MPYCRQCGSEYGSLLHHLRWSPLCAPAEAAEFAASPTPPPPPPSPPPPPPPPRERAATRASLTKLLGKLLLKDKVTATTMKTFKMLITHLSTLAGVGVDHASTYAAPPPAQC